MPCFICRGSGHNRRTCPLVRTIQPLDSVFEQIIHHSADQNDHHVENDSEAIPIRTDTKDHVIQSSIPRTLNLEFPIIQLNGGFSNTKLDVSEAVDLITDRNAPICCMVETPSKKKANQILDELKRQTERDYTMICEKVGYEYITMFIDKSIFNIKENYEVNLNGKFIDIGLINNDTGEEVNVLEAHFPRWRKHKAIQSFKDKINDQHIFTGDFNCNPEILTNELMPQMVNLAINDNENPTTQRGKNTIDNIGSLKKENGRIFYFNEVEVDKTSIRSTDHYPVIANICAYVR